MDFKDKLKYQLALDYGCSVDDIKSRNNIFITKQLLEGRRQFKSDDYLLKVLSIGGKAVFCVDESIYERVNEQFKNVNASWINHYPILNQMNDIVKEKGYMMCDQHHYYLPDGNNAFTKQQLEELKKGISLEYFEGESINRFKGDERFKSALSFCDTAPDVICLTASIDGEIVGMSGASADSSEFWQIGIDVSPECRGRNIGALLTILLKEEILSRGKVPFYGTAESHIQSQKVAIKSGFTPAWWEVYAYRH